MEAQAQQRGQAAQRTEEEADEQLSRKMICRYGRGCTHIHDVVHREKFWHPPVPRLSADEIERKCICNECGMAFDTLTELQSHLIRKTAWSNHGLCGCRVSLLLDNKQWYEGIVLRFEKGKHLVQIRTLNDQYGERRWLDMRAVAFYVVELPDCPVNEVKEPEDAITLRDCEDERWTYAEDITLEYAYAQWMLYRLYGNKIQETGHKTKGHVCLTDQDKELDKIQKGSLLYGELLPRGVNKALDSRHLDGRNARVLFDLGMGTGKVAIQAFLQFRNLQYVYGVELSAGRYSMAEAAVVRLAIMNPHNFELRRIPGKSVCLVERIGIQPQFQANMDTKQQEEASPNSNVFDPTDLNNVRVLHLVHGDMLQTPHMDLVDIVMLETDVPSELLKELCRLLAKTKDGCRALTYLDLNALWSSHNMPFRQLETNRLLTDRFPTSWSVQRGHHFYMWMNSRSSPNRFRRNGHDGLTKHNKFATRCAKFFARLFPSKHRTRAKYKPADCIIPFDASPTQSNAAGLPTPAVDDAKDDRLLRVMFNIIAIHPLCEKPEELSVLGLSDAPQPEQPPADQFSPSLTEDWFEAPRRERGEGGDCRDGPASVQGDRSAQADQPFSNLALDSLDDCKYGPRHAAPATAEVADDQNCSVS